MGNARNIAFWVVLFLLILALFNLFSGTGSTMQSREISYSEFVEAVESGNVSKEGRSMRKFGQILALAQGNDAVTRQVGGKVFYRLPNRHPAKYP